MLKNKYKIEFVEFENTKPFVDFIMALSVTERAKVFETINYFLELKNNDLPIKEKLSKHLIDGIFELRITMPNKIARTLYFYQVHSSIVITHGFIKKRQKTPLKEISRAKALRKKYLEYKSK
jgi:phage-related protein